ncbi:MAG: hypothetical protein M3040_17850 [Bacteroidota bacterium]|nr:hypothetical protein [Bacteroidota bacterium]
MKQLLPILFTLLVIRSHSQNRSTYLRDSTRINDSKKSSITLYTNELEASNVSSNFPFANIVVEDVRFDTSYVAVGNIKLLFGGKGSFQKINLTGGSANALSKYLNGRISHHFALTKPTLVCYLKNLRLTQEDSLNKKTKEVEVHNAMIFEIEGYLAKGEQFFPATRLDTIAVAFTKKNNSFPLLEEVLDRFVSKVGLLDTGMVLRRSSYSAAQLDRRYQQRFEKQILTSRSLTKGVYTSSTEFINNNPSIQEYQFEKDKKATILYTRSNRHEWLPARTAFGFCDGHTIWINVHNIFHPLVRQGNTFEFIADINYANRRTSGSGVYIPAAGSVASIGASALISAATTSYENYDSGKSVYQIDMETGEFY